MKKTKLAFLTFVFTCCLNSPASAADVKVGKTKAIVCASCHGIQGISPSPLWPNLAGQKALYIEKQLKAFRDGTRKDPMMEPMAKPLSDEDIADISAYFASLE